jgi:lysozyme
MKNIRKIMNGLVACAATLGLTVGAGQALAQRPLGIDVSEYQGSINWSSVYSDGVRFAFAKATEGYDYYQDPDFKANMANGKAAGVLMGAYHFSHPYANTPAQEAGYFWSFASAYIKADGKSIMPMIDFEVFDGVYGGLSYTTFFNDWSADIIADGHAASVTLRPVIYCSAGTGACDLTTSISLGGFIANYNGENLYSGNPWSCCTGCNAWDPGTTGNWTYWQVSDSGSITGISGDVDLDTYPDTLADLKSWQGVTSY